MLFAFRDHREGRQIAIVVQQQPKLENAEGDFKFQVAKTCE
jgi:hypothetical protein